MLIASCPELLLDKRPCSCFNKSYKLVRANNWGRENLTASTWRELETKGKFDKNAKLSFICDDMLILGCDVGSETHYLRAIDTRGRELSKSAFSFSNNADGFSKAKEWAVKIAVS